MATITTDTYFDDAARTANEAWTINNGAVLTIRTDTRWHYGSPASMTGSVGSTTISATQGGGLIYDGTKVRWMPYDSGGGTVPAIGTTISQGAVEGYLLGVWETLTSAPTAVGASVPTTGFLKFREVTGGAFSAGALSGITASATGPDVVGWIEIVRQQTASSGNTINVPRLGYFRVRGEWFDLGTTNGSAGQTIQVPTNGGGVGTHVPGCWIETGSGSGSYEFYPAIPAAAFITANIGTDARSKFVCTAGDGVLIIGGNGVNSIGFVPESGCKIRIANVLGRQCAAATQSANAVPHATLATRPVFTTTSAGDIDIDKLMADWYFIFASPYRIKITNSAIFDTLLPSNQSSAMTLTNFHVAPYVGSSIALDIAASPEGGTITNCKFFRTTAGSGGYAGRVATSLNFTFDDCHFGVIAYARNAAGYAVYIDQSINITVDNCKIFTNSLVFNSSFDCYVNDIDYTDRIMGTTNSTTGNYIIRCQVSSNNINVDGVTIGLGGTIANSHPYAGLFYTINSSNCTFRNAGTRAAPIGGSTNAPAYIFQDGGVCTNIRVQRCYLTVTRTSLFLMLNTSKIILIEHCHGTVGSLASAGINATVRSVRAASNSVTGQASCYGTHWQDMFDSDTTGRIWLALNEPTTTTAPYYSAVQLGAGAGFTSGGQISMPNLNDQIIFETPFFIKGHTGFQNTAPTLTGTNTGNFTYKYQIDKNDGNGWNGSWNTLDATTLSGETGINASNGFKLKIQIITVTANVTNALTYIRLSTTTTTTAMDYLYPADYTNITINGIVPNSRVYIYDSTNLTDILNVISTGSSISYETGYVSDFNAIIRVMYMNGTEAYLLEEMLETVGINGITKTVSQTADWVYNANAISGSDVTGVTIKYSTDRIELDEDTTWPKIYARRTYRLYQENGIGEKDVNTYMIAIDPANYILSNFKLLNVTDPNVPVSITGGWAIDSVTRQSVDLIDNTGGSIFNMPEHVVAYYSGSGGGGSTPAEIWAYSSRTLSDKTNFALSLAEHANISTDVQNGLTTYTAAKKKDVIAASQM